MRTIVTNKFGFGFGSECHGFFTNINGSCITYIPRIQFNSNSGVLSMPNDCNTTTAAITCLDNRGNTIFCQIPAAIDFSLSQKQYIIKSIEFGDICILLQRDF